MQASLNNYASGCSVRKRQRENSSLLCFAFKFSLKLMEKSAPVFSYIYEYEYVLCLDEWKRFLCVVVSCPIIAPNSYLSRSVSPQVTTTQTI